MESGPKHFLHKVVAWLTWLDLLILVAAAASGVFVVAAQPVTPSGQSIVFLALFGCASVLIGVEHTLDSMRRPLVAFAFCLLGGVLGGALLLLLAMSYLASHPLKSHGEYGAGMAAGIRDLVFIVLSPVAVFLIGFPVTLAICAGPIKDHEAEALRKPVEPELKDSAFVASVFP